MEEELEKRLFVCRRGFKYYGNVSNAFLVSKFIFCASSLSACAMLLLASSILGVVLIEMLEKYLRIAEIKAEYKTPYSFYLELLAMYKAGELINEEIIKRDYELCKTLQFFPREKIWNKWN